MVFFSILSNDCQVDSLKTGKGRAPSTISFRDICHVGQPPFPWTLLCWIQAKKGNSGMSGFNITWDTTRAHERKLLVLEEGKTSWLINKPCREQVDCAESLGIVLTDEKSLNSKKRNMKLMRIQNLASARAAKKVKLSHVLIPDTTCWSDYIRIPFVCN